MKNYNETSIISNIYFESLKKIPGLDIEKMLKCFDNEKMSGVRFNTNKINLNDVTTKNSQKFLYKCNIDCKLSQINWCKTGFYFDNNVRLGKNLFHEMGLYYLQEPSAMAPAEFLNVQPDDVVLDLCASPGGKTTQIAEKLNKGSGFLISNEIIPQRAKVLAENVQRLGFNNVVVTNHSPKDLEKHFVCYFDKILVDAPCSGEGMFRKNNNAILEWDENLPINCAIRQKEIVESAYKMLKSGGTMVYSTCTFSLEENEEVIKFLLDNHKDLIICDIDHKKFNFDFGIDIDKKNNLTKCARLYPYNIDGEGHFFAVLKKQNNIENQNINLLYTNNNTLKNRKKINKNSKNEQKNQQNIKIFEDFEKKYLNTKFNKFVSFGELLYCNCPLDLDKLKVNSVGLFLGEVKNNNFIPSLHLAHFLTKDQCKNVYELNEFDAKKYLEGYELDANISNGWVLLTYKDITLCFGKCVNNKIKNHYPKNLRKKI